MQKLDSWHVRWVLVLVLGVMLLAITLVIALSNSDSSTFANVASIWGLFVGLIGLTMTLYILIETQDIARKAQREIQVTTVEAQQKIEEAARQAQDAVRNAHEQTRQVLERVRHGVREADFATLHMWVRELRTAARQGDWPRALLFGLECPAVSERLRNAEGLEEEERNGLRRAADNLRLLAEYIRNKRLETELKGLPANHAKTVEELVALLEQLGGRLHHEVTKGATP
jgi:hypothetical protein